LNFFSADVAYNHTSQGNLSKDEIEKLLRHGAYDIFNEEKAGEGEKVSNEFIEQDIDSILERRSRVVVHDNTGSGSIASGGTFSKASFKARSQDPHSNSTVDVDVDDPDFWKKFFKDIPEDEEELQHTKRQRIQKNYSERSYAEHLELVIADNDDDSSATSDEFEVDGTRLAWGGSTDSDWRRSDAEAVVKFLCTYGYCDGSTPGRLNTLVLKEKHSSDEVSSKVNNIQSLHRMHSRSNA
jgi:hypothetical protein